MSRLGDKARAAAAVAPRQAARIEARADAIIAQESGIEKETDEAFAPHEALLSEAQTALGDVKHALAVVSNGAPLPASIGSSEAIPAPLSSGSEASTDPATH